MTKLGARLRHLRRGDPVQREKRAARLQLWNHHARAVRRVAEQENWAEQPYCELEVEVQPGRNPAPAGTLRRLRRRKRLRRRPSLTHEIRHTKDPLTLIRGEPGSGKSIALRHLTIEYDTSSNTPVPLYVNLKGFDPQRSLEPRGVSSGTLAQAVFDFVLAAVLEGAPDNASDRFAEVYRDGLSEGGWLILLDSFDELPDVLGATTDVDEAIEQFSAAVEQFASSHSCNVVVASRFFRAPRTRGWALFRILPLSDKAKDRLAEGAGLHRARRRSLLADLSTSHRDMEVLTANPLFFTLLCRCVRHASGVPEVPFHLFSTETRRRLTEASAVLTDRYETTVDEILTACSVIAYVMTRERLGLQPARALLDSAVSRRAHSNSVPTGAVLEVLELPTVRLARGDSVVESTNRGAAFSFVHRRFQEFFATLFVIDEPEVLPVEELLDEGRWRETAVTLCQLKPESAANVVGEAYSRLERSAIALGGDGLATGNGDLAPSSPEMRDRAARSSPVESDGSSVAGGAVWPEGSLHVLGVVQSGFASAPEALPIGVRETIGRILEVVWRIAEEDERETVLDLVLPSSEATRTKLLRQGFRSGSYWLSDTAYRQVARLRCIPAELGQEMRIALVSMAATGRLYRERETVTAQVKRVNSPDLLRVISLLRAVRIADVVTHGTGVVVLCVAVVRSPSFAVFDAVAVCVLVWSYFSASEAWAPIASLARRREPSIDGPRTGGDKSARIILPGTARLMSIFFVTAAISAAEPASRGRYALATVLVIGYLFGWPYAAVLGIGEGVLLRKRTWILLPVAGLAVIRQQGTRKVLSSVAAMIAGGLVGLMIVGGGIVAISVLPSAVGSIVVIVLFGSLFAFSLWAIFVSVGRYAADIIAYTRWSLPPPGRLAPLDFLALLADQRSFSGIRRMLALTREERLLEPGLETERVLVDLLRATRLSNKAEDTLDEDMGVSSPAVRDWVASLPRKRLRLILLNAQDVRDDVVALLKDVRDRREELS